MSRAKKVHELFMSSLFLDGEDTSGAKLVAGVILRVGFNPERLERNREAIREVLTGLPVNFYSDGGRGWSFLNLCVDAAGSQWGEHRTMDELICLGIATGYVEFPLPRDFWSALPGAMPYVVIKAEARKEVAA